MKHISIDKVINLPLIERNIIHQSANVTKEIDHIKSTRNKRLSFSHKINNFSQNKIIRNNIKIFTPIRQRLSKGLRNIDQLGSLNRFNSFDLPNNPYMHNNMFLNGLNILNHIEIPIVKYQLLKSPKTKRKINLFNLKDHSEASKVNNYSNVNEKRNYKYQKEKKWKNKIGLKKSITILKKINNYLENNNYCFLSYAYNEYDNIPKRKAMEDFHCIKKNLLRKKNNINNIGVIYSYFAIFDGHGGKEVSSYLSQNLHQILISQLKTLSHIKDNNISINNIISLIQNTFTITDKIILGDTSLKNNVGSTATIVLLLKSCKEFPSKKYIICANIGDSRGYILSRQKLEQITNEHNCRNENEVSRIKQSGGIVFNNRVYGTLMLTRSFGDKEMKKYGVTCEPDIFCKNIEEDDKYIIIASDGVWDVVNESEIMTLENGYEERGKGLSSDEFSKQIVNLAINKGTIDNVSCIVIKLKN